MQTWSWSFVRIVFWGALWSLAWFIVIFWRRNRDNCLTWAVNKMDKEGGYLVIRFARHSKYKSLSWPHFLWLDKKHHMRLQHYIPKEEGSDERWAPSAWFEGKVVNGDPASLKEN